MFFSNLELARRLEAAEGNACAGFARARRRLFPECSSEAIRLAGADVVFDGVDAPTTQTFGLGMLEEATEATLEAMERFFAERGAATMHEVSPFAGVGTLGLLCARGYRPMEISNVLYQAVEAADLEFAQGIRVRVIEPKEGALWTDVSARGWRHEHPELEGFLREFGHLLTAREDSVCFLAEVDGQPGAAGALAVHGGVALLAGAATVPELRRRGLQGALLRARLKWAHENGCDLAMMVTEAGSNSQRNAEWAGFRVAYTRMKWVKS